MTKILVTDDSSFMREIIKEILNKIGYSEIIEAETGQEAIDKLKSEKPDLIILDFVLPLVKGDGVLKFIKENNINTKAIVVSSLNKQDEITKECMELGAKDFITKPFTEDKVANAVKSVLGG